VVKVVIVKEKDGEKENCYDCEEHGKIGTINIFADVNHEFINTLYKLLQLFMHRSSHTEGSMA
jgi:hypothetical protein